MNLVSVGFFLGIVGLTLIVTSHIPHFLNFFVVYF